MLAPPTRRRGWERLVITLRDDTLALVAPVGRGKPCRNAEVQLVTNKHTPRGRASSSDSCRRFCISSLRTACMCAPHACSQAGQRSPTSPQRMTLATHSCVWPPKCARLRPATLPASSSEDGSQSRKDRIFRFPMATHPRNLLFLPRVTPCRMMPTPRELVPRAQRAAGAVCAWRVKQIVKVPSPSLFGDSTTQHKEGAHTPHTLQAACISPLVPPTRSQPRPGDEATGHRPPAETGHVSAHCHLPTNSRRSDQSIKVHQTTRTTQRSIAHAIARRKAVARGEFTPTVTPSRPAL